MVIIIGFWILNLNDLEKGATGLTKTEDAQKHLCQVSNYIEILVPAASKNGLKEMITEIINCILITKEIFYRLHGL